MSDELSEYLRAKEPGKAELAGLWRAAIGLQKVDGLTPSAYLVETARRNIEGEITIAEAGKIIGEYYKSKAVRAEAAKTRTDEADIVSQRITGILAEPTFSFSPASYVSIHRKLFAGVYKHAGKIRDYNITKSEWVLKKDTVRYESADVIAATLEYEFERERRFNYKGLSPQETIAHFSRFIADVWQIHAFGEGNTRTTAIFAAKYLRTLGYTVENDIFADNSFYFRNALVRANYTNVPKGIHPTLVYLERFFANLLLGENNELKSRYLLVGLHEEPKSLAPSEREQVGEQVREQVNMEVPKSVARLLKVLKGEMSVLDMMVALKLGGRRNFLEKYLTPSIELGLVEMTQPNSPRSPTQKYRLTAKGQRSTRGEQLV
jgi:fido (protein-threonine AMPylation protein)